MPQAGSSTVSPKRGIDDLDHEAHHRPRRVELAVVCPAASRISRSIVS